jgi:hypothetical protein
MKQSFVHLAQLVLETSADPSAPGGAVTIALCGSWDHPGACRWPHQTSAEWDDRRGSVRVVFVSTPEEEGQVRALIDGALGGGQCIGPEGKLSRWELTESGPDLLLDAERALGAKLAELLSSQG